jgi:hypothetical protein
VERAGGRRAADGRVVLVRGDGAEDVAHLRGGRGRLAVRTRRQPERLKTSTGDFITGTGKVVTDVSRMPSVCAMTITKRERYVLGPRVDRGCGQRLGLCDNNLPTDFAVEPTSIGAGDRQRLQGGQGIRQGDPPQKKGVGR